MVHFLSDEWIKAFCEELNKSEAYASAAKGWEGNFYFIAEPEGELKEPLFFTPAQGNDNPYFLSLLQLKEGEGYIYLFDGGYFKTYGKITSGGNFFLTTLHENISYKVFEELPHRSMEGIVATQFTTTGSFVWGGGRTEPTISTACWRLLTAKGTILSQPDGNGSKKSAFFVATGGPWKSFSDGLRNS